MKKAVKIIIIVVVALALAAAGFILYRTSKQYEPSVDYDELYAAYDPELVVAKVNDEEITWDRFYNVYSTGIKQYEYTFVQYKKYYGVDVSWDDEAEEGITYEQIPVMQAEDLLKESGALKKYADETGNTYDPNDTNSVYDLFAKSCGECGEQVPPEDAIEWMEQQGYKHIFNILLSTKDLDTDEELDDEQKSEKKNTAEEIAEKLKEYENEEERLSAFSKYMEEYNEDPGMIYLENGYTFMKGDVFDEIYSAVESLGEYETSDVIETDAGYNVIIRLPLNPNDNLFEYYVNEDYTTTGSLLYAYELFNGKVEKYLENTTFEYADGFTVPPVKQYIHGAIYYISRNLFKLGKQTQNIA